MNIPRQPTFPDSPFAFLLVEGGDEEAVCCALAGPSRWAVIRCWNARGRTKLVDAARVAVRAPNFEHARAVGIVLDAEHDVASAKQLASQISYVFTESNPLLQVRVFLAPDGVTPGAIESLCRRAVRNPGLAACVDALMECAGHPHASNINARANEDEAWLAAYLAMGSKPGLRLHQAFAASDGIDHAHPAFDPLRRFLAEL